MMKNFYKLLMVFLFTGSITMMFGQERYHDEIFESVTVTEGVKYGTNISILPIILQMSTDPAPEDMLMDIYEPEGDTLAERPVVILAHRGDFLPPIVNLSPYGTRQDSAVVEMCKRFARRGFVAASIDYRLGWNPLGSDIAIKKTVLEAVYRITQDMRTCVRYFRMNATEQGNLFRIDTTKFAVGGFDAAGFAAENVAFLKTTEQTQQPKFLDFSKMPVEPFIVEQVHGNPYGTDEAVLNIPNHVGYSSDVSAVIDFEGGLGDFNWIEAGDPPVIAFQRMSKFNDTGIHDVVIGVGGAIIIAEGAFPDTIVHQSQALGNQDVFIESEFKDEYTIKALERTGGIEGLYLYNPQVIMDTAVQCDPTPGVPATGRGGNTYAWNWYDEATFAAIWDGVPGQTVPSDIFLCTYNTSEGTPNDAMIARQMIDTLQAYIVPRLVVAMGLASDTSTTSQYYLSRSEVGMQVFPNPSSDRVQLRANQPMTEVQVYNLSGRLVLSKNQIDHHQYDLNISHLASGMYIGKIRFEKGILTEKIVIKN